MPSPFPGLQLTSNIKILNIFGGCNRFNGGLLIQSVQGLDTLLQIRVTLNAIKKTKVERIPDR